MMMTVQKLISKLRKMPPRAVVCWQDHDQSEAELNNYVGYVAEGEQSLRDALKGDLQGRRVVVLRP